MKVGLLTTSFPRRAEADVAGQFVLGFARALVSCGHQVEVLAPEPAEALTAPELPGIALSWVPYLRPRALQRTFYGAGVLDNLSHAPWTALGVAPFVLSLAYETRRRCAGWDAIVSHWALPCALAAGVAAPGLRHLAVLHSGDVSLLERMPWRALLARRIAVRADSLLFVSRALRSRFLALLAPTERGEVAARAHVCAMGIDAEEASTAHEPAAERTALRVRLGVRGLCVLSMGRLIALKGIEHAIDALAHTPDVTLIVAGAGPMLQMLQQRAAPHGARVRFVGELFGDEKRAWLRAADAFVLPSIVLASGRSEGMPSVLLEAMEHGLPVLASDVGGVSDVVRPGENGFLLPSGDARAIAQALNALADPQIRARLSENARSFAAQYHWSELGPRLSELLFGADFVGQSC